MFTITEDKTIHLTRGDVAILQVTVNTGDGEPHIFAVGDIVRFKILERKNCESVILQKDTTVVEAADTVDICLEQEDTKFGGFINKPTDYWYEIELNPETKPQTIVGYDAIGPKIFRLYPEGGDKE